MRIYDEVPYPLLRHDAFNILIAEGRVVYTIATDESAKWYYMQELETGDTWQMLIDEAVTEDGTVISGEFTHEQISAFVDTLDESDAIHEFLQEMRGNL